MGPVGGLGGMGGGVVSGCSRLVMELLVWKSEGEGYGGVGGVHEIALKDQSSPVGILEVPCLRTFILTSSGSLCSHTDQIYLKRIIGRGTGRRVMGVHVAEAGPDASLHHVII